MTGGQLDLVDTAALARAGQGVSATAAERVQQATSEHTLRAYARIWDGTTKSRGTPDPPGGFVGWCLEHGRTPLPATEETFGEWVNSLCDAEKAPATISQAMACVRSMHTRAGHDHQPPMRFAELVFRGYKRARADAGAGGQKMAPPLSPTNLRRMIETCDPGTLLGARDRALLVIGYGLMGRRSEIVALNVSDVAEDEHGLLVYIGKSKTDQDAEGETVAIPKGAFDGTDPVAALHGWLEALASREGAPAGRLLRSITKGGGLGRSLSPESVGDVVKQRARLADLPNAASYSAHSLRAGGLTAALRAGVPIGVAARHGRWKPTSPVVNKYARTEDRWRDNAMRGVL